MVNVVDEEVQEFSNILGSYAPSPVGYDWWSRQEIGTLKAIPSIGYVKLIDKDTHPDPLDSYDELGVWMVFEVTDFNSGERRVRFFRINGYVNSSDGEVWDGVLHEVEAKEETKVVFKRVER